MPAPDRLFSLRTVFHMALILVLSAGFGLAWNASRGRSDVPTTREKQIDLEKQYFAASALLARGNPGDEPETGGGEETGNGETGNGETGNGETGNGEAGNGGTGNGGPTTAPDSGNPAGQDPTGQDPNGTETDPPANTDHTDRLAELGLQAITAEECELYRDEGIAVFADARDREDYEEGHIPGAYYLNHYLSADLIEGVRADFEAAFMVIVYCNGGDCDDSINLALDLTTVYGFANENVYVFDGGLEAWKAQGYPVVTGGERE